MSDANPIAVAKFASRAPVTSPLDTAGWADVPLDLRERALFSAEVEKLRLLQRMKDRIATAIGNFRRPDGVYQTREEFVAELSQIGREEGLDSRNREETADRYGTLKDITSEKRLRLIYDFQIESAHEFARWKSGQDKGALNAFPAQEFRRVESRHVPRQNWPDRWLEAGGKIVAGRMLALKNAPVWTKLSRFGVPWPPFDFGSGMGLVDISRREAEALGVMSPGDKPEPQQKSFNEDLQASVADLDPVFRIALKKTFGNQVELDGDVARWVIASAEEALAGQLTEETL